jgi:transposase-like protein
MPLTPRTFSPEFEAQVVLQLLRGDVSQAEICRKHKLSPKLIANWKAYELAVLKKPRGCSVDRRPTTGGRHETGEDLPDPPHLPAARRAPQLGLLRTDPDARRGRAEDNHTSLYEVPACVLTDYVDMMKARFGNGEANLSDRKNNAISRVTGDVHLMQPNPTLEHAIKKG